MKIIIIATYVIVLFIIAVFSALRAKKPGDYFVAGKNNGALKISGSLLATILGAAAILGTADLTSSHSWAAAWYLLAASAGLWLLLPLVSRVSRMGKFTLTDMIGRFYGAGARKTASVIIPVAWTGIVAAQIIAAGKILFSLFALPYEYGVIVAGSVFAIYTLVGGQSSILKTDIFQSLIILSCVVLSALFLSTTTPIHTVPPTETFPFNSNFGPIDLFILFLTFSSTFVVGPDIYSRVFCAKDEHTARRSVITVATILVPFAFILTYLGVTAYENLPAEKLQNTVVLIELIDYYLPEWVTGLMAAALLSVVLSSADTTLLSASMIMSELVNEDIDNIRSWNMTRAFIVVTGIVATLTAMKVTSIIGMLLLALAFYSGAFIVPLLLALMNMEPNGTEETNSSAAKKPLVNRYRHLIKVNKRMAMPAMITGGLIALAGKILLDFCNQPWGNGVIISAFVVNFLMMKINSKR